MKTLKRLKIVTILFFVTILIFASFFGVYKKEDFRTVNIIKEYDLGMDFTDTRVLKMTVSTAEEKIIYDLEGNVVQDDGETDFSEENGYTTKSIPVNAAEVLTTENYKTIKKILKNRLKGMDVGEYKIELNEETGEVLVELQENDSVEETIEYLKQQGEFAIIDKETEEVLLDNSDVKIAKVVYGQTDETGTSTTIYLQIDFNKEGAEKLEEISQIYVAVEEEEHVHDENTEEEHEHEEVDAKYVSVVLDGQTYSSTYFGEKMSTGSLYIPITSAEDNETITKYGNELNIIATIINNGTMPIEYEYTVETVASSITKNMICIGIAIPACMLLIACIVLIIKFRVKGFVATFLQIGYIAVVLLIIRYTNVIITLEGFAGILLSVILNYIFIFYMLNKIKNNNSFEWKDIGKFALKTIIVYVVGIICTFNKFTIINSFGMTLVWGSFCLYIYNLAITRNVFKMMSK